MTNDYITIFYKGRLCRIPLDRITVWDNNNSGGKNKKDEDPQDENDLLENLRKSRESIQKMGMEDSPKKSATEGGEGFSAVIAFMAKEMEMQKIKKKKRE